ncbi:MAG: TRAP transporter permease [Methyloligellaceae bacterium]
MSSGFLVLFQKIGLISEEMTRPRKIEGPLKILISLIAVAFSYFFIHISYFGPPVAEIFKGTFMLGVAILVILVYKIRQKPIKQGFVFLDELICLLSMAILCGLLALWFYWQIFDGTELWRDFTSLTAGLVTGIGALIGLFLYWRDATRDEIPDNPVLSDWLYILAAIAPIVWWIITSEELTARVGSPVPVQVVIFSGLLVAVSFDIARRVVGPIIPVIGLLFLIYSFEPIAQISPGLFEHQGYGLARVMEFLMLEADGMTGLIIEVFATFVVIFVIVGAFLEKTGLGALFIDTTYRITGARTGGPGLASVTSSGLFGMISGSGVANVVTTGTFTIPLMKRVGYRSEFAGAVEASASTGGAYMPPIMGAGAFLLAQLTEVSYFEVIKIALIPALFYYLSVGLIVYLRAVKQGLHGVPVEELPSWKKIFPRLPLLLPVPFMVYYLVIGDSAFLAAVKTISLIIMLKTADLLNEIPTPWSEKLGKPFLAIAIVFGIFAYFFGLTVGAPFSWFADTLRGLNYGDALLWTVAGYIFLKLCEIVIAGFNKEVQALDSDQKQVAVSGPHMFSQLGAMFRELVRVIWASLEAGARNTLVIGCIAGVLGILLSSATQSDLPGRISAVLIELSFGLLPLTIFWVIVAGYVVGMGLPIVASYVILVIFSVAALTNLGVPTLAAHLICYWVAVVSAVTPPVALAAYAASAIAKSDPVKTGTESVKLASMIFIMPFMFVYTPILLDGTQIDIAITVVASIFGILAWATFLEGHTFKLTNFTERLFLCVAAACLLLPLSRLFNFVLSWEGDFRYQTYIVGIAFLFGTFILQRMRQSPAQTEPAQ